MCQINELSLRAKIERADIVAFLSRTLGVEPHRIGTATEYWEYVGTDKAKVLGLDVHWSESGFKTFCKWFQDSDLSYPDLLDIAAKASSFFQTDIATGDCMDSPDVSTDQFLIVTPAGQVFRAYATMNSGVFDVAITDAQPLPVDQVIRRLREDLQR